MNEQLFEKIGLTKGETKVYFALNKIGESTIGKIVFESRVSKSKVYDILEKLIRKGLIGYIIKNGRKYFVANNPNTILDYLEKKEEDVLSLKKEVQNSLPQLMAHRLNFSSKRISEVYEGFNGLKAIREELILTFKPGETLLVLGAPKIANEKWEGWFLDFHSKRIKRKVRMKIIYNSDAVEYGKIRKKMKLTEVKYLPNNLVSPNWIDIFSEAVLFVILLKEPLAFVVRDKNLANSFKSYFEIMWKNAKK